MFEMLNAKNLLSIYIKPPPSHASFTYQRLLAVAAEMLRCLGAFPFRLEAVIRRLTTLDAAAWLDGNNQFNAIRYYH